MIDKECTIQLDWIGWLKEHIVYVAYLLRSHIILVELARSAAKVQISASTEPITIQPYNIERFPLTVWQRPRTQDSYRSAAIEITYIEVTNYSDEDADALIIALSKVEEQFNQVMECRNLFPKTIPSELPSLRNGNHRIDPKPESEWLPTWRP